MSWVDVGFGPARDGFAGGEGGFSSDYDFSDWGFPSGGSRNTGVQRLPGVGPSAGIIGLIGTGIATGQMIYQDVERAALAGDAKRSATAIVNQWQQVFVENLAAFQRGTLSQTEAIANFPKIWAAMIADMRSVPDANVQRISIADRARGGKFDWFASYLDPIMAVRAPSAGVLNPFSSNISPANMAGSGSINAAPDGTINWVSQGLADPVQVWVRDKDGQETLMAQSKSGSTGHAPDWISPGRFLTFILKAAGAQVDSVIVDRREGPIAVRKEPATTASAGVVPSVLPASAASAGTGSVSPIMAVIGFAGIALLGIYVFAHGGK